MQQHNRVTLIVGGSTGMGKATARMLLAEGRTVIIASRTPERLAKVQAELDPDEQARWLRSSRKMFEEVRETALDDIPHTRYVEALGGLSAHAGQTGLVEWIAAFDSPRTLLVHGENSAQTADAKASA